MKVAINTFVTPGKKIGVGIYIDNLLKYYQKASSRLRCQLLVSKSAPDLFEVGPAVVKKKLPIKSHPSWLQVLWQPLIMIQLLREKPDVLHVPNTYPLFLKVCPTVISILDLQEFYTNKYGRLRGLYRKIINYVGARVADRVITISHHSKRDIVSLLGIPEEKVSVTHLSADSTFRRMDRGRCHARVSEQYGLSGAPYILSVGELHPGKNFVRLIQAYSRVKEKHGEYKLVIVGKKGWDYQDIFNTVATLGLKEDIIFTGYVPAAELPVLYNGATLTVFPTLYEGFGLPALEAMACGTPLIAGDTSSLPEVVGDAGILVDPYDVAEMAEKMDMVLSDAALQRDLVEKGEKQVAKFSWEKTALETMNIYSKVCRNGHREKGARHGAI